MSFRGILSFDAASLATTNPRTVHSACQRCLVVGDHSVHCTVCHTPYCCTEHLELDRCHHQVYCRTVKQDSMCLFLEMLPGHEESHPFLFPSKREGCESLLAAPTIVPYHSSWAVSFGWNIEVYCDAVERTNKDVPQLRRYVNHFAELLVNELIDHDESPTAQLRLYGRAYVTGRHIVQGTPLTRDTLRSLLTFAADTRVDYFRGKDVSGAELNRYL